MGLLGWLWGQRSREASRKVHFDQEVTNISTREKTNSLVVAREKPRFWLARLWLRFLRFRRKEERQRGDSSSNEGSPDSRFTGFSKSLDQVTNVVPFSGKSKKELQLTNVGTHRTMRCNCMSSLNSWDSSWSQCHYCHLESPQQDEWARGF